MDGKHYKLRILPISMRSWTISASAFKIRSPQKILLMQLKPQSVSVFPAQNPLNRTPPSESANIRIIVSR